MSTETLTRSDPVRVAVVGTGKMGAQHVRAIQALGPARARVVGVVDPRESARAAVLERVPPARGAESLGALLDEVEVDVVHVCTPMELHARITAEALERGAHVYVEKPVTETLDDLLPLLRSAEERGLEMCAGHQVLFETPYLAVRELLPKLGRPIHVESYFTFRPVRTGSGSGRPLTNAEQLVDVLPHPSYLLLDVLQRLEPEGATEVETLQLSNRGTVHGIVRRGELHGTLVASLEGRPVEHWLKVVGTNGTVHADFVRGTVQELLGPGTSGIDKALNPFRLSRQIGTRTFGALARRVLRRSGSYSGLHGILDSFYAAIRSGGASPTSADQIRGTVAICEDVRQQLRVADERGGDAGMIREPEVVVTGGTGFLGREVVLGLIDEGMGVRVVTRRMPPARDRVPGAEYVSADLGGGLEPQLLSGIRTVVHCAAETAGSWEAHQRNSIDATKSLVQAASDAGVERFIHVSSVAVQQARSREPVRDDSPLHEDPRALGPYVWGKLESERVAVELAGALGLELKVVRPAPLVDWRDFDPPGRLGRRVGNLFVAVGSPREPLVVGDTVGSAAAIVAAATRPDELPDQMNLVPGVPPTRRELVEALRRSSPEASVVWLPWFFMYPLSWAAIVAQKVLRSGRPALNLASAFASRPYEAGPAAPLMTRSGQPRRLPVGEGRAT